MHKLSLSVCGLLASALFAAPAAAQSSCSTLAVTGGAPNTKLEMKLTGAAPNSAAFAFLSTKAGTTKFNFGPLGALELGLASPVIPVLLGRTDSSGAASLSIPVPPGKLPEIKLKAQATSMKFEIRRGPPALKFCVSNIVDFTLGGGS